MTLYKRGDIMLCADGRGDYTSKPRPVVIVQNSDYLNGLKSVTICPMTSVLSAASVWVRIKANATLVRALPTLNHVGIALLRTAGMPFNSNHVGRTATRTSQRQAERT